MIRKKVLCLALAAVTFGTTMVFTAGSYLNSKVNAAEKTVSAGQLIKNTNFKNGWGVPWTVGGSALVKIFDGSCKVTVPCKVQNLWDASLDYNGITLEKGHTYEVSYTVTANSDCKMHADVCESAGGYKSIWHEDPELKAGEEKTITGTFDVKEDDPTTGIAFQLRFGGEVNAPVVIPEGGYSYTFTNVSLKDKEFKGYTVNDTGYAVRTNQVGYFTKGEKTATVVTSAINPVPWKLVDAEDNVLTSGITTVFGKDEASGDFVHRIDFSSFKEQKKGCRIVVDTDKLVPEYDQLNQLNLNVIGESPRFDIQDNLYSKLKYDALKYFYQSRSDEDILAKYSDGRDDLARKHGALDTALLCSDSDTWYVEYGKKEIQKCLEDYGTNGKDVSGGWYDAGDHGKYVVNSGISTWTLQNEFERALNNKEDISKAPYGDNTLNLPGKDGNDGVPDILNESRYNLEFMLKMQIDKGNKYEGMVHHCAHDKSWTGLGMYPSDDGTKEDNPRLIYAPTTAATLDMAATAAQAARLWNNYDGIFSDKCITAAERAWDAAVKNPAIYAPKSSVGGGTYDDDNVNDEFYWAACELYATTGEQKYLDYMKSTNYYLDMPNFATDENTGAMNWANVEALGTLSLLTSKNNLPAEELNKIKVNVTKSADSYVDISNHEGYGVALKAPKNYIWASNADLGNIIMVMAYANDINGAQTTKYIDGANKSMDYILGNNANAKCYVTGYGTNPVKNPHHRFWAHELDTKFPQAPAGVLAGGPNQDMNDPCILATGWTKETRPAAKCYIDDIQSYSTNECAINWNAPLAWTADYLDSHTNEIAKADDSTQENGQQNTAQQQKSNEAADNNFNNGSNADENIANAKKNKSVKTGEASFLLSLILCGISTGAVAVCYRRRK